jgi:hypothetical protein
MNFVDGSEMPNHSRLVVSRHTREVQPSFVPVISLGLRFAPEAGE